MRKLMAQHRTFISFFFLVWITYAQGQCQYEGRTYLGGQSWKSENCRYECACEGSSVFCQPLSCTDPGCDFSSGEIFVFTQDEPCCPICDRNPGNCKYQGQYFLDGTNWTTSACELCSCSSGIVSCSTSNCSSLYCAEDEVPLRLRNDCCPRCLLYETTCIVDGIVYQHGERWAPNQCMLCQCENGREVCYISICAPLVCEQDEMLKTAAGECCPQCVKFQCEHAAIKYQNGDYWWMDPCTFCQCTVSGVTCQERNCTFHGKCPEGQELIQKTGSCCPSCVSTRGLCYHHGELYSDGEIWKSNDCSTCACRNGQTFCQKISCPLEQCQMGELRVLDPDQCCPVCRRPHSCNLNGVVYQNEAVWKKDTCTMCRCRDGKVTCFVERCSCDNVGQQNSKNCCLACEKNSCDPSCKECMDTNPAHCTECLDTQHVLHHGKCLFDCERGYFINERKECQPCYPTCAKCFGALPSQCLNCQKGLLRKGHCVDDCGFDFYEENGKCVACHTSCSQCHGPGEEHCLACTLPGQLLQGGRCVDYCTGHYYIADRNCMPCNATCARCLKDGSCQFCPEEEYLENGFCVEFCSGGYYSFMEAYCLPCHPNCLLCYGPMSYECTVCPYGFYLLDGSCVSDCGQGYYRDQGGGVCIACHPDCHLCLGGGSSQCLSCANGYLLPHKGTSFGRCVNKCPLKYYLAEDGKCEDCYETCQSCFGSNDTECLSCTRTYYLKNNKCVPHCSAGFFVEPGDNTCYPCHPTCSTCKGWGTHDCLSCHLGDVLHQQTCISSTCKDGEFLDTDSTCKLCHSSCETCVANPATNASLCVLCKDRQSSILGEECISKCGENFYRNSFRGCEECHSKCASCERYGANGCASCWEGNSLTTVGTCVASCIQGYFSQDGICEACDDRNCFRCVTHSRCEQCVGKYVLQSGKCVHQCNEQQYVDLATRKCTGCSSECVTCIGPTSNDCSSCTSGKLLQGGTCIEACTEGYYEEEAECRLCDLKCKACSDFSVCTSCEPPLLLLDGECVSDCGSGKYEDFVTFTCSSCPAHCTYCLTPDDCGLCDIGYYFYQSKCFPDCPSSHYSDSSWRMCERNENAPLLIVNDTLVVGVGNIVPINVTVFNAVDQDTDFNNIRFIIVEKPQNGALIRKSSDGGEIILEVQDSFTVSHVLDGWIFFKHYRKVPLSGHLVLKVSDRQLESPGTIMPIQIASYDPPILKQKEPLIAYSNTVTAISPESFHISDRDNFEDVMLQIIQGPHQGILAKVGEETKITQFTASDILNHQIAYKHLNSQKRNKDAIIFRATDGYNFQFAIYTIFIIPEDVGEPVVVVNKPVYVKLGTEVKITAENLYAADRESDATDIHFSLQGSSAKTIGGYLSKAGGKKLRDRIKKFTQHDINRNFISYHHENPEILNGTIRLKVTSTKDPIRHFAMVDFQIHVLTSNFTPLQDEASESYGMRVLENHASALSSFHFPVKTDDIDAKDMIYEIVEDLRPEEGQLELHSRPGVKITSFTHADLQNSKIIYRPPPNSVPRENFHFLFTVKDGVSDFQLHPVQKFTISIIPMNNPGSQISFDYKSEVTVDQGRSVLLPSNFLSPTGHEDDIDMLEVLLTEVPEHGILHQGTGPDKIDLLEGDGFSFTSLQTNLFYTHFNGSDAREDKAVFSIMSRKHTTQNLLKINIMTVDKESPVILDSSTLMGSVTEGEFFSIERRHLAYTDLVSADSDITFTLINPLQHGYLEKLVRGRYFPLRAKDTFTQQDINEMYLRYKAKDDTGSGTVRESVYLNVTDGSGNTRPNQVFSIKIKPKVRKPPVLTVLENLEVEEHGTAYLGPSIVQVSDPDSHTSDLVIFIDQQPKHGYVDNSRPNPGAEIAVLGLPVYSFPYVDVLEGFINYKQESYLSAEPTWDYFTVHVTDGRLVSQTLQINVTIKPVNDEAPIIVTEPLYVSRGGTAKVTNSSLSVIDVDSDPGSLMITLESTPLRGEIFKLTTLNSRRKAGEPLKKHDQLLFQEILDEVLIYGHHNFHGLENDSFRISVTDGEYSDSGELRIIIVDSDKEAPYLDINRGLELKAGSSARITNSVLHAADKDSEEDFLIYEIVANPSSGQLILLEEGRPVVMSHNPPLNTFSQKDINQGYLSYVHNDGDPPGIHSFKFNVRDLAGNSLLDKRFIITIKEDVQPPSIIRNTGMEVTEGGSQNLSTDRLFVNDTDSDQEKLSFLITSGPTLGHLELRTQEGKNISKFEWSDLVGQNVRYVHTSETEDLSDNFIFKVSDGKNYAIQTFHITILPVDDSLPHVTVKQLRVSEGSFKIITLFELKVSDLDTQDSLLSITITTSPSHGLVIRGINNGQNLSVNSFSMEDIYKGEISYLHDGSDSVEDSFKFIVSDGTNPQFVYMNGEKNITTENPVVFPIDILPVDDSQPVLTRNTGLKHLISSEGQYWNEITKEVLHSKDADTEPAWILYTVRKEPTFGILELAAHPGKNQVSFTQEDINQNSVRYVLIRDDLSATEDSFIFNVQDTGGNVLRNNVFSIMWSRINFTLPSYNISETSGLLKIGLTRFGSTHKNSFVQCEVRNAPHAVQSADSDDDFELIGSEVAFEGVSNEKYCMIRINDDAAYEGPEVFAIQLTNPTFALLGAPSYIWVFMRDDEDVPSVGFQKNLFRVNETQNYLSVPVVRTGDINKFTSVTCSTLEGTAKGSGPRGLETGSDFRSRFTFHLSLVIFQPGVSEATCDVKIIDDSFYEEEEEFMLILSDPYRAKLSATYEARIIINGPNDVPVVQIASPTYTFNENAGEVNLEIVRTGPDLSKACTVWCNTEPSSAHPGQDYLETSVEITLGVAQSSATCPLVILDDSPEDKVEGSETLVVFLSNPVGCILGEHSASTVTIRDEEFDVPQIQFALDIAVGQEAKGKIEIPVTRDGDLSLLSSVRCITRQDSALAGEDFEERTDTDSSLISFLPGEKDTICSVKLFDDAEYEGSEFFQLRLTPGDNYDKQNIKIGDRNSLVIEITDEEDAAVIQLENAHYVIEGPKDLSESVKISLRVVRTGDVGKLSRVRIHTEDGSALSGSDYHAISRQLEFKTGERQKELQIEILYNNRRRWSVSFGVSLNPDDVLNAELGNNTEAIITITDSRISGSSILPAVPVVVSLLHYDDAEKGMKTNPSAGYPLVCLTPCDPQYPNYEATEPLCKSSGVDASDVSYTWEIALPADADGSMSRFEMVTDSTLFTSAHHQVLDSIYFRPNVWVRCVAQPKDPTGILGVPVQSKEVKISSTKGICHSPTTPGRHYFNLQSQSFVASLRYVKNVTKEGEDRIHIQVKIPHQDGMLPLISTFPLYNIRHLLTQGIYRHQHVCSNLHFSSGAMETSTNNGFLQTIDSRSFPGGLGYSLPYQFDTSMRENDTLALYRHLNLKNCTWTFDAWYHMTQLVDLCGGIVTSDFKTRDSGQTYVSVQLPLYVSYVFAAVPTGWTSLEHKTELQCSFFYNTVLWKTGLKTDDALRGILQVTRLGINRNGQLFFEFKTEAKFRGLFVVSHHTLPGVKSRIFPPNDTHVLYSLELLWSERTYDGPTQLWKATSNYNLKDYSGLYVVELIPCRVATAQVYAHFLNSSNIPCTAYKPQRFEIPLAFQQTNRPVPLTYSLNTVFQILNNEKLFFLDPFGKTDDVLNMDYKGAFSLGDMVYGKVFWSPEQDLKSAYELRINKVVICAGINGYAPTYDPMGYTYGEGPQFGCIQSNKNIKHRFMILDRNNPDAEDKTFHEVPFEAKFLDELPHSEAMSPGTDGFAFKVDALYKVNSGYQWFLQVMYTIGPSSRRFRRSLPSASASKATTEEESSSYTEISAFQSHRLESGMNGTNIRTIRLDITDVSLDHPSTGEHRSLQQNGPENSMFVVVVTILAIAIVVLILVMIFIKVKMILRSRRHGEPDRSLRIHCLSRKMQIYSVQTKDISPNRGLRDSGQPKSEYLTPNSGSIETDV